jgi:iron(III) transport system substrate-binding protein
MKDDLSMAKLKDEGGRMKDDLVLTSALRGSSFHVHPSSLFFAFCLMAALVAPAAAQSSAAEIAGLQGADRTQRLVEGAKKEGTLTIYTSATTDDMGAVTAAFEKKYGVKANVWRAGSEAILQRAVTEARGRRYEVDIFETNGPELEALHREQILQEVKSPHLSELMPQAVTPHREWIATRLNIFVAAYNTNLVQKDALPKTWRDLLDPKWKGKLGIEAYDHDWYSGVIGELGEPGLKLFREIVAANGISVRKGHTLLSNLVVSGEVPLALTVYHYRAEHLKSQGAPIDWFVFPPAIARPNGVAMARRAPRPHAAVLFFDFMLSDAQDILLKRSFTPTSTRLAPALKNLPPLKLVDSKVILDEGDKWTRLWDETIIKQAR